MNITWCSRMRAESKEFVDDLIGRTAIISISTPREPPAAIVMYDPIVALLRLSFADTSGDFPESIQKYQADAIAHFYYGMRDTVTQFVIHCDAGQSRSPAVAAALSVIEEGNGADSRIFQLAYPNTYVRKLVMKSCIVIGRKLYGDEKNPGEFQ